MSAVNDMSRLLADPQVQALALHQQMAGDVTAVGTPIRIDGERSFHPHLSARVGQDTQAVLAAAGLSADEIATLAVQGAVQT